MFGSWKILGRILLDLISIHIWSWALKVFAVFSPFGHGLVLPFISGREEGMPSNLPPMNSYDQNILNEIPLLIVIINNLRQRHEVYVLLLVESE